MRKVLLVAAAALLTRTVALTGQDVMAVASAHYRVLVDNDSVRVVENRLAPGEKDPTHTHPAGWYYVTKPGKMKVVYSDGKTQIWDAKKGEQGWMAAEGPHTSENVGSTPLGYVLVEVKSAGAK